MPSFARIMTSQSSGTC